MISVSLSDEDDFEGWRDAARTLLHHQVPPEQVSWRGPSAPTSLFEIAGTPISALPPLKAPRKITVPKKFIDSAQRVICHSDPDRFARLYAILWSIQNDKGYLRAAAEPDIIWMTACDKAVRRDRHKMHAFVRFRQVGVGRFKREQYAAWFEPSHFITRLATPFFMRRFPNMDWVIVTPHCTAIWDGKDLVFGPGGRKQDVPIDDSLEEMWKVYFNSIFNPARLKIGAMMSEMPKKYWHNMPETDDIKDMIQTARSREQVMREAAVTTPHPLADTLKARAERKSGLVDSARQFQTLPQAKRAVQACQLCPLYRDASQAVFGEGPDNARLMIIGEQPGDLEDIAGRPFIGPAGQVLDEALSAAGINRGEAYVTNAVKHFKFKPRGKRRIHDRPSAREIDHCRWWLDTERALVKPEVIIALGASAARSMLGKSVKISEVRGNVIDLEDKTKLIITIHPAYLLRIPNAREQDVQKATFVRDLELARGMLG